MKNRHPIVELILSEKPIFMIELLLHKNEDADFHDGYWHSIKWAWPRIDIVELLLSYGANPDIGHASHGPGVSYLATAPRRKSNFLNIMNISKCRSFKTCLPISVLTKLI
jgi:ankyrin repeat protein